MVVADGLGDSQDQNKIKFIDVGSPKNRLHRIFIITFKILIAAKNLNAKLYHFHDPELIFSGFILKLIGKKVIFDVHEDISRQILTKEYLNKYVAKVISLMYRIIEIILSRQFDGIICATDSIANNFNNTKQKIYILFNYPLLNELIDVNAKIRTDEVVYIGAISEERGLLPLLGSLSIPKGGVKLNLAGKFSSEALKDKAISQTNWTNVCYHGQVNRQQVKILLSSAMAGIVTFLPAPNHINALPNKLFEYMSAGLPIIASNFPNWVSIIQDTGAGICVDPKSSAEIGFAIQYLKDNKNAAIKMGQIGRELVRDRFNWEAQERQLTNFYLSL